MSQNDHTPRSGRQSVARGRWGDGTGGTRRGGGLGKWTVCAHSEARAYRSEEEWLKAREDRSSEGYLGR